VIQLCRTSKGATLSRPLAPQLLPDCTASLPEFRGRMSDFTGWDREVTRTNLGWFVPSPQ
jgi:hypothetical protein